MHSAGARALREDDNEMSREAVLLQWERKIEAAERLDAGERVEAVSGRFVRTDETAAEAEQGAEIASPVPLRPVEDVPKPPRFERAAAQAPATEAVAERRTITITGQPTPARRRRAVVDSQLAQPDRIALWAFLLGLLLVAVAAGTAHA
ncbi:MAG: hypothetical protein QOD71_1065 [Thermoleophilaceae bacterium]|jgi:hypothetical protein|nr:hypothetical protein [Thermoleophilaceae bacterium]